MARYLSIGQFARASRLSVKMLRRYDAEGLLRPALVDPDSGYRYYAPEQSRDAVTIGMLRRLEIPIASIRTLLSASPKEQVSLLAKQRDRMARELADKQAALASVEQMLEGQALLPHVVRSEERPPRRVATLGFSTEDTSLEVDTTAAVRQLMRRLEAEKLSPEEPLGCAMHEPDRSGRRRLSVFVGLPFGSPQEPSLRVETYPGGTVAVTHHRGSYDQLGLAHAAVFAWVHEREARPLGPVYEHYLNDPDEVAKADLETELWLPIEV